MCPYNSATSISVLTIMSIRLSDIIYAIIRCPNGHLALKTFPLTLDYEPSDKELCQYFNYSVSLSNQYPSDLHYLPLNSNLLSQTRQWRRAALAFKQTIDRIQSEYDVVAISHRRGGWKTYTWNYSDDISFEIYSNFGYGSCSELVSRFFYKGHQLTPYSDYVRYRFANYAQLIHYTYNYRLEYSEWKNLMNDTLVFYNAICENQENEVFRWVRRHLNRMISGLEKLLSTKDKYFFSRPNNSSECVTGDELEIIKANKTGGTVEFIKNIEELPYQVNHQEYIKKLSDIGSQYIPYAETKAEEIKATIDNLGNKIDQISSDPAISVYDRLYKRHYSNDNWSLSSNRIKMIRHLLTMHNRLGKPFTFDEIRNWLNIIQVKLNEQKDIQNKLYNKRLVLEAIEQAFNNLMSFNDIDN